MSNFAVLKTVLLGDAGVGKTSLVRKFVHGMFKDNYLITIGLNVYTKRMKIHDREVTLSINDIAGQQRFESIRAMFLRGASIAIYVYDLTRPKTLKNITNIWDQELKKVVPNTIPISKLLVGNKADLKQQISISPDEAEEVAKKIDAFQHIITSAKEGKNVDKAFYTIAEHHLQKLNEAKKKKKISS